MLKVICATDFEAQTVLYRSTRLRATPAYRNVYGDPDLTPPQQQQHRQILSQRRELLPRDGQCSVVVLVMPSSFLVAPPPRCPHLRTTPHFPSLQPVSSQPSAHHRVIGLGGLRPPLNLSSRSAPLSQPTASYQPSPNNKRRHTQTRAQLNPLLGLNEFSPRPSSSTSLTSEEVCVVLTMGMR
eukprot:GHVN01026113.1.p1 GENE.GHVN01026113.1~~GHVN01026113.1.p1  ORF type:complete len:183 (+),score=13.33 GHVN01026113.1:568-1116(+)